MIEEEPHMMKSDRRRWIGWGITIAVIALCAFVLFSGKRCDLMSCNMETEDQGSGMVAPTPY